jgi:hypothetical protein
MGEEWLGVRIDEGAIRNLQELHRRYRIHLYERVANTKRLFSMLRTSKSGSNLQRLRKSGMGVGCA